MASLRFLLLDDHQIVREGVRAMIERVEGWTVAGEAEDGLDGIKLALTLKPDVVVTDMMMPGANGLDVARRLRALAFNGCIVMLSAHVGEELYREARAAGVTAILPKSSGFAQFTSALQSIAGTTPPNVGRATVVESSSSSAVSGPSKASALGSLTPRECQVLQHIASGQPPKQIAETLGISQKTLDVHRHRLMQKLKATGTADLTRIAVRSGLVNL
jgi:DNA-binding NarL/FixJ family response regulator